MATTIRLEHPFRNMVLNAYDEAPLNSQDSPTQFLEFQIAHSRKPDGSARNLPPGMLQLPQDVLAHIASFNLGGGIRSWAQQVSLFHPLATRETAELSCEQKLTELALERVPNLSARQQVLTHIFTEGYNRASLRDKLTILEFSRPAYTKAERVALVVAEIASRILNNIYFRWVASFFIAAFVVNTCLPLAHEAFELHFPRCLPFVINNTPLSVIRLGNKVAAAVSWALDHRYKLWVGGFAVKALTGLYPGRIERFGERLSGVLSLPYDLVMSSWDKFWHTASFARRVLGQLGTGVQTQVEASHQSFLERERSRALNLFLEVTQTPSQH